MKKFISILIIFILSIFFGYLIGQSEYLDSFFVEKKTNKSSPIIDKPQAFKKFKLNYLINENNILPSEQIDNIGPSIEKLLSSKLYDLNFVILPKLFNRNSRYKKLKKIDFHVAVVDPISLGGNINSNNKLTMLFKVSDDLNFNCYGEIQGITLESQNLNKIEDLANKKVAVSYSALPIFKKIILRSFLYNKKLSEIHLFNRIDDIIMKLQNKEIDAIFTKIKKYDNNTVYSKLLSDENKKFINKDELKSFFTSDTNLPCEIMYIKSDIPDNIKESFTTTILDTYQHSPDKTPYKQALGVGDLQPITDIDKSNIINLIIFNKNSPLKAITDKVIK
jgi:hypothetical protein